MVRVSGCFDVATRANCDSDHDRSPDGAAVDTMGKRLQAAFLSGRPTGSLRPTPPPLLLHHVRGRQQGYFNKSDCIAAINLVKCSGSAPVYEQK
jgi:hypothetical protein